MAEREAAASPPALCKALRLHQYHMICNINTTVIVISREKGLVVSSPWRKRKMGWLHPTHGAKDHQEKETHGLVSRKEEREAEV